MYCYCCSKTFSTVAQKSLQMNLVFIPVMNGIERVVCLSQACLYAFKGTLPEDGVAVFRPQFKSIHQINLSPADNTIGPLTGIH